MTLVSQRQYGNECLLASVAIATGDDYQNLRRRKKWRLWRYMVEENLPWSTWPIYVQELLEDEGFDARAWVERWASTGNTYSRPLEELSHRHLRGTGLLFVDYLYNKTKKGRIDRASHAMAYKNYRIVDPSTGNMYSVATYLAEEAAEGRYLLGWDKVPLLSKALAKNST